MSAAPLHQLSVTELAKALRDRKVSAVEAATEHRHTGVVQEPVAREGKWRVIDHDERVAVLDEVFGVVEVVCRLVVDSLELDLAAVHSAFRVLGADASFATGGGALARRRRDSCLGRDVAECDVLGSDAGGGPRLGARIRRRTQHDARRKTHSGEQRDGTPPPCPRS